MGARTAEPLVGREARWARRHFSLGRPAAWRACDRSRKSSRRVTRPPRTVNSWNTRNANGHAAARSASALQGRHKVLTGSRPMTTARSPRCSRARVRRPARSP